MRSEVVTSGYRRVRIGFFAGLFSVYTAVERRFVDLCHRPLFIRF